MLACASGRFARKPNVSLQTSRRMKKRQQVLFFLVILAVITFLDRISISVAAARMQADLHIETRHWGWILGAFVLSYGLFEIPTGALGDKLGPRRVLTRVVLWWSAFTALTGLMRGFYGLLLTRFLFGVGKPEHIRTSRQRWHAGSLPGLERKHKVGSGGRAGWAAHWRP